MSSEAKSMLWRIALAGVALAAVMLSAVMLATLGALTSTSAVAAEDHRSAVILIYHRFGEDAYPSTNIRIEQFEAQIAELQAGGYAFVALDDIVSALRGRRPLPDLTVAITVDDGYETVLTEAWPRLKAAGIPLTVFIATDPIDAGSRTYMTWDQVRQLAADGVTIAHHGASHHHMLEAGLSAVMEDIARASTRFQEELGFVPKLFAYPYGEYSRELETAIEAAGFRAAFAQYSSVARSGGDVYALPRFPINERYGDIARLRLIARARSLPTANIIPDDPVLGDDNNPPAFGFSLTETLPGLSALACYPSHLGEAAEIKILAGRRLEVRFDEPFPEGRNRINCTMPGPDRRWYWFGRFFLVPPK